MNGKIVVASEGIVLNPKSTKDELWNTLQSLVSEEIRLRIFNNNLVSERDTLKQILAEVNADNHHLKIQLEVMTEKFEDSKRTVKRYARLYEDVLTGERYKTNEQINCADVPSLLPVAASVLRTNEYHVPTWLNKIFDRFGL